MPPHPLVKQRVANGQIKGQGGIPGAYNIDSGTCHKINFLLRPVGDPASIDEIGRIREAYSTKMKQTLT